MPTPPDGARLRWRRAADVATVGAFAIAFGSVLVGGLRLDVFGIDLSIRNPWRPFFIGVLIAALRHRLFPGPSVLRGLLRHESAPPHVHTGAPWAWPPTGWSAAGALGFFFATTAMMLWPQVLQPYSVPDLGDPLFSIWRLSWVAHQLPRDPWHLFDANIFHPHLGTLAYSDAMLLPALAAAPFLWLGIPAVLVYNLLFASAIALSGAATFGLVRNLTGRGDAALVSGLLFAFCAFRFLHYSHLELQMTVLMPVALYALHKTIVTRLVRHGVLLGLALGLQTLSSFYYGAFFCLVLGCVAVVLWATERFPLRTLVKPLGAGAALALALVVPPTIPYWQARTTVGERPRGEVAFYSATPGDYLAPHARSVYRDLIDGSVDGERDLFPGVVPVALAALAIWPPLSAVRLAYAGGLLVAYELSLGMNGHTYPLLYDYVAPFRGFRAPARFAVVVALMLSVLAGLGLTRALNRLPVRARLALVATLAVAVAIEAQPRLSLTPVGISPPPIYRALPADRTVVIADLPLPPIGERFSVGQDLTYMYFSTFHWHRLINGASGFFPDSYHELKEVMHEFPSPRCRALLRRYGVEFVVVHEEYYSAERYAQLKSDLAGALDLPLIAAGTWEGREIRLHQLIEVP